MADEPTHSASARLWLQAVAIPLVLAVGGFWQFYLKERVWPAAAINLTTDVTIKEAGLKAAAASSSGSDKLEAIELVITARNPSSSTVYLLANYWVAWGTRISSRQQVSETSDDVAALVSQGTGISAAQELSEKSDDWLEGVADLVSKRHGLVVGKHYTGVDSTLVALGPAFNDNYLRPNEKVSATYVFYVPEGVYDLIEVGVSLPTTSRENPARTGEGALGIDYKLNSDRSSLIFSSVYRIDTKKVISTDEEGTLSPKDTEYYGWQGATSNVELSLWPQAKPSEPTSATKLPATSSP
jgi:hypothetical protein